MPIRKDDGMNAVKRYQAKCDCITIRPLKEKGEAIRSASERLGFISITQFILTAVDEYLANHQEQ